MSKHKDKELLKKRKKKKEDKKKRRKNLSEEIKVSLPHKFSLLENYEIVLSFINSLLKRVSHKTKVLTLNMMDIKSMDVAALIYTKIILRLLKKGNKNLELRGYYPSNHKIKDFLIRSGISIGEEEKLSIFKIRDGKKVNTNLIPEVIKDLENENIKISLASQKALYSILLELMDNTEQHAYPDSTKENNWYFYLQPQEEKIKFVFLDSGEGITETIRKQNFSLSINNLEKVSLANTFDDSTILRMALAGYRVSATRKSNRNKGLPNIFNRSQLEEIKNLKIISRKAVFNFNNDLDLIEELKGTLFYWEVDII